MISLKSAITMSVALSWAALVVAADAPQVEVTSFYYTNPYPNRTAEICGEVKGAFTPADRVVVVVDPGDRAGHYTALPAGDGGWCVLVNSQTGRAQVSLFNGTTRTEQGSVSAQIK